MVSSPSRTFPLFRALIKAWPRASRPFTWLILLSAVAAFASEIREFDLKTIERLSNELTRVSQTRGRGATIPDRKRALQSARGALQGKMLNVHYDYVVLDDPDGSGFLVCALGSTGSPRQFVLGGHIRFIRWPHRGHNRSSLRNTVGRGREAHRLAERHALGRVVLQPNCQYKTGRDANLHFECFEETDFRRHARWQDVEDREWYDVDR
jgi:hypothetical protein